MPLPRELAADEPGPRLISGDDAARLPLPVVERDGDTYVSVFSSYERMAHSSPADDADRVLAVCDDVILSHEPEGDLAVFDREAGTFAAAVGGALADFERVLPAARVLRVEAVPAAGQPSVAATR